MKSIIQKNHHAVSFKVTCMMVITLLMISVGVKAQNVTISPKSGSLISSVMNTTETGFKVGLSSLWRHEQLALSMTASDRDAINSETGEITQPSSVIGVYNGKLSIVGGRRPSYLVVSLPKGYKITGYKLVLVNDMSGSIHSSDGFNNINSGRDMASGTATMRFFETKPWQLDGTNSGTNTRASDTEANNTSPGYNNRHVRWIELGSGYNYSGDTNINQTSLTGPIGTAATDVLATAEAADGDTDINPSDKNKEYSLERYSTPENPMGNHLYFRLVKNYYFYGLTIKSFEIFFSAEGTFDAEVSPEYVGDAKCVVKAPFFTSKTDIGDLTPRTKDEATFFSYDYHCVHDVVANNYVYQENAVENGVPNENKTGVTPHISPVSVDGNDLFAFGNDTYYVETPVSVETSGGEAPIGYRIVGATFKGLWGEDTNGGERPKMKSYYEFTMSAKTSNQSNATTYYIGEGYGTHNTATNWFMDENGYVKYKTNGNNFNYLTIKTERVQQTTITYVTTTNNSSEAVKFKRSGVYLQVAEGDFEDNYVCYGNQYNHYWRVLGENATQPRVNVLFTGTETSIQVGTVNVSDFYHGKYKLTVYDKTGENVAGTVEYDSNGNLVNCESNTITLNDLNNDAVKFKIESLENRVVNNESKPTQALVSVVLQLQALDPYIDKMDIVCHDPIDPETGKPTLELTQSFTASDFSVSGGRFIFYVPKDYADDVLTFTFSDLYSKYGDYTYYKDTPLEKDGNARYSFVTSDYFDRFNGVGDGGLYDPTYDAAEEEEEPFVYTSKVATSTAGNVRFKFNNAENLGSGNIGTGNLEEYPFSVATYLNNYKDPDWEEGDGAQKEGEFVQCVLMADPTEGYQKSGIFFVFTADETRYNIAKTTAWQHRYYAFYRMEIELVARTFNPDFKLTKIYDATCYDKDGTDAFDSMWGLELDVSDMEPVVDEDGNYVYENGKLKMQKMTGYFTYQEIIDYIKEGREKLYYETQAECDAVNALLTGSIAPNALLTSDQARAVNNALHLTGTDAYEGNQSISEGHAHAYNATLVGAVEIGKLKAEAVPPVLKKNSEDAPASMKQILYIDGTPLSNMLNSSQGENVRTLSDLKKELTLNSLVFLPVNTTSTLDNVAYKTLSGGFQAGHNIELTDKLPFYTPYSIQVAETNYATYTRKLTRPEYGQATNATIMLPFTIDLEGGKHKVYNDDDELICEFSVNNMISGKKMQLVQGNVNYGTAYFEPLTDNRTKANKPYMVNVETMNDDASDNGDISFIATQYGSTIEKTPAPNATPKGTSEVTDEEEPYFSGSLIMGDSPTASYKREGISDSEVTYYFTNYASYSGGKFDRAVSENVFYFAKDMYLDLHTLYPGNLRYLMNYPFRAVYIYSTSSPQPTTSGAKMMKGFVISYDLDDMESMGIATKLDKVGTKPDLMIRSDRGMLTITASRSQDVVIRSVNGMVVKNTNVEAGNTTTVALPAGIYIVNNAKIAVK